jgi:hypothetical protein
MICSAGLLVARPIFARASRDACTADVFTDLQAARDRLAKALENDE